MIRICSIIHILTRWADFDAGMADDADAQHPRPSQSQEATESQSASRSLAQSESLSGKKLARQRKQALKSVTEKLTNSRLFKDCLVIVKHADNRVETFAESNRLRRFVSQKKNLNPILTSMDHKLSQEEIEDVLSFYGNPPTPQPALRMLNAKAVSNLLRAMQFEELKKVEEEDRPAHMEYFQEKYICLGKYLDADQHGMVAGKFLGKNQKDGRFKSQDISEDILCTKESWRDGECPQDGSHISFEDLLGKPISQMTRSMAVAAIYLHLEWVHPGTSILRTYTNRVVDITCTQARTHVQAHARIPAHTCMQ